MKNYLKTGALISMLILVAPLASPVMAATPSPRTTHVDPAKSEKLEMRLEEIKAMDLSTLSRKEKRALRKEVKSIEKQQSDGVYISVGAIIIIILLLIILL